MDWRLKISKFHNLKFSFVFHRNFLCNKKVLFYELRRHFWTLLHKIKVAQNSILHNKSDRPNYFDEIWFSNWVWPTLLCSAQYCCLLSHQLYKVQGPSNTFRPQGRYIWCNYSLLVVFANSLVLAWTPCRCAWIWPGPCWACTCRISSLCYD